MKPDKQLALLAIGDCNTAGTASLSARQTIPGQLAERLSGHGWQCKIQNLGYTMSTSREGLARSSSEALPCDLLLLNFGLVDAWITSIPAIYISYYPDNSLKKLFRKLLKSLKKRLRGERIRRLVPVGPVVPLPEFIENIENIISNIRRLSPHVQVILWGTVPVDGDHARNEHLAIYDNAMREVAGRLDCQFLDTVTLLRDQSTQNFYLDSVHLSAEGCRFMADAIYQMMIERNLPAGHAKPSAE